LREELKRRDQELADARARLAEERNAREALEARLQALEETRQPPAQPGPTPLSETHTPNWPGRDEAVARLENARAVGDADLTQALSMALDSRDQAEAQGLVSRDLMARLERMEQGAEGLAQRQQAAEAAEREAAFERNPFLKELYGQAQAGRPGMWNAALATANQWGSDPQWQGMNWEQRFAAVEREVRGQFGLSEPAPLPAPIPRRAAPNSTVPPSLTHIPGGETRDPDPRTLSDIDGMPVNEQVAALARMADANYDGFLDQIAQLPYGALNVPGARPQ
jgi:hypothetical protein